jgi:hypothetical protein
MKQFLGVYRYVRLISEIASEFEEKYPVGLQLSGFLARDVPTFEAKQQYVKKHPKINIRQAQYISVDAIQNGYLQGDTLTVDGQEVDVVCLTTKGRKLIDLPFGTLQEFLSEYGFIATFLTGGVVVGAIVFLSKILVALLRSL